MNSLHVKKPLLATVILSLLLLVAGCNNLEVDVVIDESGGGTRQLRARLDSEIGEASNPPLAVAVELLGITRENGWKRLAHTPDAPTNKKRKTVFETSKKLESLSGWDRCDGDISIRGSLDRSRKMQLLFTNAVDFAIERDQKRKNYTYRESYSWISFLEYYTDYESTRIWRELLSHYPSLQIEDECEFMGLLAGLIAMTTDLQTGEQKCEDVDDTLERILGDQLHRMLHRRGATITREELTLVLDTILGETNDSFDQHLQKDMPGAYLATKTEITVTITFPGRLVESNASKVEGQTATWTFYPLDAIAHPIDLILISEIIE